SGEVIVLILGPTFERMVMAFVAVETRGQEKVGGIFHRFGWGAENFPITGFGMLAIGASGGEDFAGELVVGSILLDLGANPGAERFCAFGAEELAVALEEVRPFVGPKINELGTANQPVNDGVALGARFSLVVQKCADFFGGRGETGQIEVDAAN